MAPKLKSKTGASKVAGSKTHTSASSGRPKSRRAANSKTNTTTPSRKAGSSRGSKLVIVESPAKARTIERILGGGFVVKASQGHVRDLPKDRLGVSVEKDFAPSYIVTKDKRGVFQELKKLGQNSSSIFLATDPDREGEAISWHLVKAAEWDKGTTPLHRVVFHEITKEAVSKAFAHTREIDMELVNAQQARRILDRLVGYQISPLLWRKVQRGLSAGRVQSVALRIVVDREREIESFEPAEYWTIEVLLKKRSLKGVDGSGHFTSNLHSVKGQRGKLHVTDGDSAGKIVEELDGAGYSVALVKKREAKQSPSPPFITSTLQQEAGRKLRYTAKRTMAVAQQLYEGLPIGDEGSVGLITYMRTDSTQVAHSAIQETRGYIQRKLGREYLPNQIRIFKKKAKGAQEAHEAIRPTSIYREPQALKRYLSRDQLRLYDLIWRRMLASQMADALSDATTVDVEAQCNGAARVYVFRSVGSVLKFPGFQVLYLEGKDDDGEEDGKGPLPELSEGEGLDCLKLDPKQHFTQPPPRYTEASLVKALEEKGIGRPSTYAPIISTIQDRYYVLKEEGKLKPTTLGTTVCDLLIQFFSDIMDTNFTARMEEELDEVARGERQWVPMLSDFYTPFQKSLEQATEAMPRVKVEETTEEKCEKCGNAMVIKTGRFGRFLACSDYPTCKTTSPILNRIGVTCPTCGGDLVQRRGRGRGRVFYGCSRYPGCDFISYLRPLAEPCPECGGLMVSSGQDRIKCTNCAWKGDAPERELAAVEV